MSDILAVRMAGGGTLAEAGANRGRDYRSELLAAEGADSPGNIVGIFDLLDGEGSGIARRLLARCPLRKSFATTPTRSVSEDSLQPSLTLRVSVEGDWQGISEESLPPSLTLRVSVEGDWQGISEESLPPSLTLRVSGEGDGQGTGKTVI
jgi:hypothetical protein